MFSVVCSVLLHGLAESNSAKLLPFLTSSQDQITQMTETDLYVALIEQFGGRDMMNAENWRCVMRVVENKKYLKVRLYTSSTNTYNVSCFSELA